MKWQMLTRYSAASTGFLVFGLISVLFWPSVARDRAEHYFACALRIGNVWRVQDRPHRSANRFDNTAGPPQPPTDNHPTFAMGLRGL